MVLWTFLILYIFSIVPDVVVEALHKQDFSKNHQISDLNFDMGSTARLEGAALTEGKLFGHFKAKLSVVSRLRNNIIMKKSISDFFTTTIFSKNSVGELSHTKTTGTPFFFLP